MCVGSPIAGTWSSSQWRLDNEFETDRRSGRPISERKRSLLGDERQIQHDLIGIGGQALTEHRKLRIRLAADQHPEKLQDHDRKYNDP